MKNKAFTLIELIIVIAILAIIMLIGTVAYNGIQERMKINADKATAAQIGKALVVRETDIGKTKGIEFYPTLTVYDELEEIENYIAKEIKPQSMKDGCFIATAIQTESGKRIIVGIGKVGDELTDKAYTNSKEAGWAWSEEIEINEFLEENKDKITGEATLPEGSGGNESTGGSTGGNTGSSGGTGEGKEDNETTETHTLTVGINNAMKVATEKETGENVTIISGGTYTSWEITGINKTGGNINFEMPENNVKIVGITGE